MAALSIQGLDIVLSVPHAGRCQADGDALQELVTKGEVGADEEHRGEDRVQKLTDEHIKSIDDALKHKEAEILEV